MLQAARAAANETHRRAGALGHVIDLLGDDDARLPQRVGGNVDVLPRRLPGQVFIVDAGDVREVYGWSGLARRGVFAVQLGHIHGLTHGEHLGGVDGRAVVQQRADRLQPRFDDGYLHHDVIAALAVEQALLDDLFVAFLKGVALNADETRLSAEAS